MVPVPLTRVELYLDVLEYQELDLCDECISELRRLGEILNVPAVPGARSRNVARDEGHRGERVESAA